MKTTVIKAKDIQREWHLYDLKGQVLGRVATQIAEKLIGKHKPNRSPNLDCGDYVVCINAGAVEVTGKKAQNKLYQRHSQIPGGFKEISFEKQLEKDPKKIIVSAVKGMLPKNRLQDDRMKRLKVFVDDQHPYTQNINQSVKKMES